MFRYYTRCPMWPFCDGHAGPTPEQREAERLAAAERVQIKRAIRREYMKRGINAEVR